MGPPGSVAAEPDLADNSVVVHDPTEEALDLEALEDVALEGVDEPVVPGVRRVVAAREPRR